MPFFYGWPTALLIMPAALLVGYLNYSKNQASFKLPQSKLVVLYLLVIFLSTFINVGWWSAQEQFITFLQRVLVFFMIIWNVNSKERLNTVIAFILALVLFIAYQAVLQAHTGEAWGGKLPYVDSVSQRSIWWGDWDGPNVLAILFLVAAAVSVEMVFGTRPAPIKVIGIALFICYIVGIYYTNSRGAMVSLPLILLFRFRDRLTNVKVIAVVAIIFSLLLAVAPSRVTKIDSDEDSASERTWLWEQGIIVYRQNPVWGIGRGEFRKRSELGLVAHNNYVQNFAELGSAGFFLLMGILWFVFKGNWLVSKLNSFADERLHAQNKGLNNALVAFCALTFFVVMELDFFFMLLGLCSAAYLVARNDSEQVEAMDMTRNDVLIIIGGMVGIFAAVWLVAVEQIV